MIIPGCLKQTSHIPLLVFDVLLLEMNVPRWYCQLLPHRGCLKAYSRCLWRRFKVAYSSPLSLPVPSNESMMGTESAGAERLWIATLLAGFSTATSAMADDRIQEVPRGRYM